MIQPNLKPEVVDFIHRICVNAVLRAIDNGTYEAEDAQQNDTKEEEAVP